MISFEPHQQDITALKKAVRGAIPLIEHRAMCATWHSDVYGDGECSCLVRELRAALRVHDSDDPDAERDTP